MFTHHCVYSRKWLSVISRAQCHWISTTARCGPDSFQKVYVTALKVVALLLAAVLQRYYTISAKKMRDEKKSASQNTQYKFSFFFLYVCVCVMSIESVESNVLFWSDLLLLPCPSQSSYTSERDPSKVKSVQIKNVRLVRDLDSITHSPIHTSIYFQGAPSVCQDPGSQKRE